MKSNSKSRQKFIIIDGNALLHRAWHALPQTMKTPTGTITNAAYGFTLILLKAIKELCPSNIVVCFDTKEKTWRHKIYSAYKAGRKKKPQELYDQINIIKNILNAFKIPYFQKKGVEADDLIGTLVNKNKQIKNKIIVTGDKDTLQLINKNTRVYALKTGIKNTLIYDKKQIKKEYQGLLPNQLIDFKALRGDPSDNIPGIKGIGKKTAIKILKTFGSIQKMSESLEKKELETISQKTKIRKSILKKLKNSQKKIKLSKKLVEIQKNKNIKFDFKKTEFGNFNPTKVRQVFQKYAFKRLMRNIPKLANLYDLKISNKKRKVKQGYLFLKTSKQITKFLNQLADQSQIVLDVETSSLDIISAKPIGISFCFKKNQAYYLSFKNLSPKLLKTLKKILEDKKIKKIGHNLKFDYQILKNININLKGIYFDTMIASYLINPGQRVYSLENLVFQYFGANMQNIKKLIGPKKQLSMKDIDPKKVAIYAAEDANFTWQLYQKTQSKIKDKNLQSVLFKIEMPLIKILGTMEKNGITLDKKTLAKIDQKVSQKIQDLETKIYQHAGKKFNIASPKQLKEILFKKLNISTKGLKKTKTGVSTAANELEKLRNQHPIIKFIFNYRELTKLKSTYIDALPKLIHPKTNRLHTSFNQVITTTGRLSSSNPNMQNIPIRTNIGRKIRQAFVAKPGFCLLSADYSQIDLRIAAHLAKDSNMIQAFKNNQDIHTITAAKLFNKSPKQVTKKERYQAKAANFGVLYGQGPRALAQNFKIDFQKAKNFIDRYKTVYPKIFEFLESVIAKARKTGFAQTLYGRRRYLPEINAQSPIVRSAAERAAINMPVQGTAADIIKKAMIKINQKQILKNKSKIKMLLQVHDELVFEVKKNKINYWAQTIKKEMENVAQLNVPLKVEIKTGDNWGKMKDENI